MYRKILENIVANLGDTNRETILRGIERYGFFESGFYLQRVITEMVVEKQGSITELIAITRTAIVVIAQCEDKSFSEVINEQTELYEYKNARYGNSFKECYDDFGIAYSLAHLKEKINRICSLLMSGEVDTKESILDSYKDLVGYCVLYIMELDTHAGK